MRYTLGSYFSIGLIQPGTIARAVKLDVAFAAETRGRTRARGGKRETTNGDWKKGGESEDIFIRASEKESVGSSGNRAGNFVDGFIGDDGAAVTKRVDRGVVTSSAVGVIK